MTYAGKKEKLATFKEDKKYSFIKGDICNKKIIQELLKKYNPEVIVHFAAESHVDRSIDGPVDFIRTNDGMGTFNLLNGSSQWLECVDERRIQKGYLGLYMSLRMKCMVVLGKSWQSFREHSLRPEFPIFCVQG